MEMKKKFQIWNGLAKKKHRYNLTIIILSIIDCDTPSMERFKRFTRNESSDEPTITSNVWADIFSRSDSISSWLKIQSEVKIRKSCLEKKTHEKRVKN